MALNLSQNEILEIVASFFGSFFAFVFFIIGQICIASNNKKAENIIHLKFVKDYVAFQLLPFEVNEKNGLGIIDEQRSVVIFMRTFRLFLIEKSIYPKLEKYKAGGYILKFISGLELLNEDINALNKTIIELSSFSRSAMLKRNDIEFEKTLRINLEDLKKNISEMLKNAEDTKKQISTVIREINFALWYEESYFWRKGYFNIRQWMDSNYRNEIIIKLAKVKNN